MALRTGSEHHDRPPDALGDAVATVLREVFPGASVELAYTPEGHEPPAVAADDGVVASTVAGPRGGCTSILVRPNRHVAGLVGSRRDRTALGELLDVLPAAGAAVLDSLSDDGRRTLVAVTPALRRAVGDAVAAEVLVRYLGSRLGRPARPDLVAETIQYLVELSGTRVESHDLTHGVIVTDVVPDTPRLEFRYPDDVRPAKRAPLLFDGQRSLLVVDPDGRARTELQRHRLNRLIPDVDPVHLSDDDSVEAGSLVAEATNVLGGLGFFVRGDRSVWTFVDGRPLLIRRGEHWTAFPLELTVSIENMIGGGAVAALIVQAAFMISAQPRGAILAVVDDPASLEGVVSPKDRYDLRNEIDPNAMRTETRLHHLIDAKDLDEHTLVRLATLDGATVLGRDGRLLAYGAVVTSTDSQHEGARTAAARTLSETAEVVLKVSVDGDIMVFRNGAPVTTLLGRLPESPG